jgi:hypothetical protein
MNKLKKILFGLMLCIGAVESASCGGGDGQDFDKEMFGCRFSFSNRLSNRIGKCNEKLDKKTFIPSKTLEKEIFFIDRLAEGTRAKILSFREQDSFEKTQICRVDQALFSAKEYLFKAFAAALVRETKIAAQRFYNKHKINPLKRENRKLKNKNSRMALQLKDMKTVGPSWEDTIRRHKKEKQRLNYQLGRMQDLLNYYMGIPCQQGHEIMSLDKEKTALEKENIKLKKEVRQLKAKLEKKKSGKSGKRGGSWFWGRKTL